MIETERLKVSQDTQLLLNAYRLMVTERAMANIYEANRDITKYVHSTSRGHEAIQIATGLQLKPQDYAAPYYRDASMLLAIGMQPYELMLQLLAKADDPFSGGRTYYSHPSLRREGFPTIPHQSSATGMQVIPTTGMAHGLQYLEKRGLLHSEEPPVVLCSLGDGSVTEGEVSEALQEAVLHNLPVFYLVQDNEWGISVSSQEMRAMNAYEYAAGFKGLARLQVDGSDFTKSFEAVAECMEYVRRERKPILLHATCPLLGHHTSGVRKEFYRSAEDLELHAQTDPVPILERYLLESGISQEELQNIILQAETEVAQAFEQAKNAPDPEPETLYENEFAPTPITEEKGIRAPENGRTIIMVDAALYAVSEIMAEDETAILYGQDVGRRLGGVFREAATLAEKYGDDRVFNMPIQEAYIIGSTAGMSAVGVKPIVEVQFCDYIWPGFNQLVTELSKSCYLTRGKFPIQSVIRVPVGAYGGGGPYHSGTHESALLTVKGIKVVYPSNAADMKGLMKAAFYDPNPVVMLEHKGFYWSKVPGTEAAKTIEPDADYVIPLGKGRIALGADEKEIKSGNSLVIITYGMGVHWALNAAKEHKGSVEIVDLRTLYPMDEELVMERVKAHGKCLVLVEEQLLNSFAESVAGRISQQCFRYLDAPVFTMGAANMPAVPLNVGLEKEMLPNKEKVSAKLAEILEY
ncbi:MAG: tungsten formylmethanofuran dehydrogenase [Sphingobacteriales bacterium]|nr:MAG: tungsten formylmethanofuran dehydrogenase [Sphingobacteriales bacterium]